MLANFSEKGSRFYSHLKKKKTLSVESTTPALDVPALLLLGILYCKSSAKTRANAMLSLLNPASAPMMSAGSPTYSSMQMRDGVSTPRPITMPAWAG